MSSFMETYHHVNAEIEKYFQNGHIEETIELCRTSMESLPQVIYYMKEIPRYIPCRDILIQAYAMIDEFNHARYTVDHAYQAGTYHLNVYHAVLDRIDEMEKARNHIFACLADNLEMEKEELQRRLYADKKALHWYIANSQMLHRDYSEGLCKLSIAQSTANINVGVKVALVDVETTGLSNTRDEIVEIGLMFVRVDEQNGEMIEVIEEVNELNEPSFSIPKRVTQIHGIRDQDVAGKKITYERFERIFTEADLLIAHNASFDKGFIQRYFPSTEQKPWHCSVRSISWKQYGFATRKLLDLCRHHNITNYQTHRALDDVKLTLSLLQQRNVLGDYYMKELLRTPYYKPEVLS